MPALAVLAQRRSDGQVRVQTRDALTGDLVGNFLLGSGWRPIEMQAVPDMDGNGVDDIATLLERKTDGLMVVQIRDATDGSLLSRVYPAGRGLKDWRVVQFRHLTFGGASALAIAYVRREDGQVMVRTQDAASGAVLKKVLFKPPPWELQAHFEVIPDFTGNGEPELAVPMRNATDARRIVQIRDAASGAVIRNITLPR